MNFKKGKVFGQTLKEMYFVKYLPKVTFIKFIECRHSTLGLASQFLENVFGQSFSL